MQALQKVVNIPEYTWIIALWQGSEYVWSTFHRGLDNCPVLNMLGHRIWQGCQYAMVTQGVE